MPDFRLTLQIDKVGDLEALNALNALDAKGRRIIEGVSGATGRAMGEVALAYERGSKSMRLSLEEVALEHEKNIRAMQRQEREADTLALRQSHSIATATRGLEMLGRTGQLTGRSLDAVVGQVSAMAFDFGPQGQIVAAIGITTAAIVEMFMRTSREMKKATIEAMKDFDAIAHRDVRGQGEAASLLYSGDPLNFQTDEDGRPVLARFGLEDLKRQRAENDRLRRQFVTGAGTGGGAAYVSQAAKDADALFKKIDAEIQRREAQLQTILGPGGTMALAAQRQAPLDMAGFVTDDLAKQGKADKAGEKLAQALAKAYQTELAHDMKEATKIAVKQGVEDAEVTFEAQNAIIKELVPDKKRLADMLKDALRSAEEAVANDPLVESKKNARGLDLAGLRVAIHKTVAEGGVLMDDAIHALSEQINAALSGTLRDAIVNGFEAAFSGKGLSGLFEGLTATVLSGLGSFMEALGAQMIVVGLSLDALSQALLTLDGPAAIAAGVALVAAGAGLKAIANSFGKSGQHGGGSYGGSYASGGGLSQIIDRGVINPDAYSSRSAASIQARPQVNASFTIIGPNDPNAVRGVDEILRRINQRGSLAGVGA